jgi:tetratricopeptide (TPR) repeat protein
VGTDDRGPAADARGARGLQIGDSNLQVNVFAPAHPAARSAYLYQVRAIAPEALMGRDEELAELADFCTRPDGGDYRWWRARAWAGKSALMSWFVLHPPPRTRIVSFFVTARLAAQNDREAFLDVVTEQLATLLGVPVPPYLTAATRAAHLWQLLDAAAGACSEQGQRLVLVVDGLDEDSGVGVHSIAALLPARPPAGMRVVVAGRHDPPVPSDVATGHPLRDPAIERILTLSPHAQVVRRDADLELKRLLRGTTAEQDLLGLVTAAGGGLSGGDLAELTGREVWEVEDALQAVVGRTFSRRPTSGWPGAAEADKVYMLGHEELQQTAVRFLGDARLVEYQQRLRTWAEQYRRRRWPAQTPGYLLRGYFRMLHAAGDLPGMISCALDRTRHDWMRDVSGGDTAALTEITTTQDVMLDHGDLDLRAMTLLAVHRDNLTRRNANIPVGLPAVWALLGHPLRAEALARSILSPQRRVRALAALGEALAGRDSHDRALTGVDAIVPHAREVVFEAEAVARRITNPELRASTLAVVARTMTRIGDADRAQELAHEAEVTARITHPELDVASLKAVARVADADHPGDLAREAEAMALNDIDTYGRAMELERIAGAWPRAGDTTHAETVARAVKNDLGLQAMVLAAVARMAAQAGDTDRAERLAHEIETMSRINTIPHRRELAAEAHALAEALAQAGDVDRAEAVARTITGRAMAYEQKKALEGVAEVAARAGNVDRAESLARTMSDLVGQATVLERVTRVVAQVGDVDRAESLARNIPTPRTRATPLVNAAKAAALAAAASAVAQAGDADRAREIACEAEAVARPIHNVALRAEVLTDVAEALAQAGDADRAGDIVRKVEAEAQALIGGFEQATALESVAGMAARLGDADRAEALARTITDPDRQAPALARVARGVAQVGDVNRAESLARTVTDPRWQAWALTGVARALAQAGDIDRAEAVARDAEAMAGAAINPGPRARARALASVAETVAQAGDVDRAEALARTITDPDRQAWALAAVARHAGTARARPLIARALRLGTWHTAADVLAVLLPDALTVVADELLAGQRAAPRD